mgnify:CR=1 FL=1
MAKQYIKIRGANEHNLKDIYRGYTEERAGGPYRTVRFRQIIPGF